MRGLALGLLAGLLAAAPAAAQGVDQTCALVLTKFEPGLTNVAYPDDSAQYYVGAYQAAPGTRIRLHGRFPKARYMSFNVYDLAQRPLDGLPDIALTPDPGSANPYLEGADRTSEQRDYTVFIEFGPIPDRRAPNTLYTGTGQNGAPNLQGSFIYRIYIPDKGLDDTGGVGLPTATIEPAGGEGDEGGEPSPCAEAEKPTVEGVNEAIAQQATPADAPATSGSNPPTWRKFVNVVSAVTVTSTGEHEFGPVNADQAGGRGGFLSNLDNAYVSAPANRGFGKVLVTRFRAPSFPDTRPPAATMPGAQLRYWSVCQNDQGSQRFVACVNDDRAVIGPDGFATFVVSTTRDRPPNAKPECGVNWLPWGPNQRAVLIYRHMLPSPGFAQSIQGATPDKERDTMGDFFPESAFVADFEKLGCAQATVAAARSIAAARRCASRRLIRVRAPRGARTVTVRIGSRRARRVRVRRGRVAVDLRGLPPGRYRVRVGRSVTRVFRTCARRR